MKFFAAIISVICCHSVVGGIKGDFKFDGKYEEDKKADVKTWIWDQKSDLCVPLQCAAGEVCLMEDAFTAVCVRRATIKSGRARVISRRLAEDEGIISDQAWLPNDDDVTLDDDVTNNDDDDDDDVYVEGENAVLRVDFLPHVNESTFSARGRTSDDDDDEDDNDEEDEETRAFHDDQQPSLLNNCGACAFTAPLSSPFVCGSDGHTYTSACRLQLHNCLHDDNVTRQCSGFCPCQHSSTTTPSPITKERVCSGSELTQMGSRLLDWFNVLQRRHVVFHRSSHSAAPASSRHYPRRAKHLTSTASTHAQCGVEVEWVLRRLDTNRDDKLSTSELSAIETNQLEHCIKPFIDNCDNNRDGYLSGYEWCVCFARVLGPCQLRRRQLSKLSQRGVMMPSCDAGGFYLPVQCASSEDGRGAMMQCWCSDRHGTEVTGTRHLALTTLPHCPSVEADAQSDVKGEDAHRDEDDGEDAGSGDDITPFS